MGAAPITSQIDAQWRPVSLAAFDRQVDVELEHFLLFLASDTDCRRLIVVGRGLREDAYRIPRVVFESK